MYKTKLCMSVNKSYKLGITEQVAALKAVGFDGFFNDWENGSLQHELRKAADENGMIYQSIHAPFGKMNKMWLRGNAADEAVDELFHCIENCAEVQVPLLIMHTFIGFNDHSPTEIGIENFNKVVTKAKEYGINIAFENTEGEEYLAAVMAAFAKDTNVGFCWDSGHEMCYNHSKDMLALYGEKLLGTHLNDNLGIKDFNGKITYIDDLHLLPFDGIADWSKIVQRLNRCRFNDMLTFELSCVSKPGRIENDAYGQMTTLEYFTEAYKRACRVAALKNPLI